MNLAKLLGAGRSFLGGGGAVSYREDKRVYLPKFNSAKNPFDIKTAGNSERVTAQIKPAAVNAPEAARVKPVSVPPAPSAPKPTRAGNWPALLNPFRGPEPAALEFERAVQVELSLEAVKVLHNDLSDADVEVVPVKSRTMPDGTPPRLPPGREPLEFFGERRFETA